MSSYTSISPDKLSRLLGTANAPTLVDVRIDEDFAADPRLIPGATRRSHLNVQDWAPGLAGQSVVLSCQQGQKLSEGTAAWLRHGGIAAEVLAGGHLAWKEADLSTVPADKISKRDGRGRTVWVTRERPKIDRIACRWLIRRFVDPSAVFLFVATSEVEAVAERFNAAPFDIENVFWSHRGEFCAFDVMVKEFGLTTPPLQRLATMVRAADSGRLDLSAEAPGLLAASLGLSRMFDDDRRHPPLRRLLPMVPRRQQGNPQLANQQGQAVTAPNPHRKGEAMKRIAALIAIGIATPPAMPAHAAANTALGSSVVSVAAPAGVGSDRSPEILRGVVAAVDERNDLISLRLPSDAIANLKVSDGLLFNAVRYGDQIEVTVKNINGAETIIGLVRE
jgi:rhodanese-related sulfurtransferase